jgi:uncharacterized protein
MYVSGTVVKIASRCNLNCSYCYIYNKGDNTYLKQPKFITEKVIEQFSYKVKNYVKKYNKKKFVIVFHGGEPMLAGKERIRLFIETMNKINTDTEIIYHIQTNAVLIYQSWCDFFEKFNINVGISIDGTEESNNNFRVYKNGKSSYSEIINGIKIIQNQYNNRLGVLTVIDLKQTPEEVYNHYKKLQISYANLLFPDDTYDHNFNDDLSLGIWLSKMYDLCNLNKEDFSIRFEQFIKLNRLILGLFIDDEYYGQGKPNTFILETNGELQMNDPIRVCKNEMSKTNLTVFDNEIDELFELPLSFMYYNNHKLLSDKCNRCPIRQICGGGYVINRYSSKNGFDNPSIYCKSVAYFICHVQNILLKTLGDKFVKEKNIKPLIFDKLLLYLQKENDVVNSFLQSFK